MVPHRDVFIVTVSEDVDGLAKMAELVESVTSDTRFMTAIPVRLQWDQWVAFRLPEGHPLHSRFEYLRYQSNTRDYDEQKTLLDQLHEPASEKPIGFHSGWGSSNRHSTVAGMSSGHRRLRWWQRQCASRDEAVSRRSAAVGPSQGPRSRRP